jgi:arylsulfatase B
VPTLIDLCGIPAPAGVKFDGRSIRPLLHREAVAEGDSWPDRILVTDSQRVKDPIKWRKSSVMTNRWRLINGVELYDIKADPGQKQDVSQEHPETVSRLRAFYEDWWAELEPTFAQATAIHLGHESENPATLTCHDWITTGSTPWNQAAVRRALAGDANTGFWNVEVVTDGTYEIRVRRWPREIDHPIDSDLAPGSPVPGAKAFREADGKAFRATKAMVQVGSQQQQADVPSGSKEIVFKMKLKAGVTTLSGRFLNAQGDFIGTYYAYVKKL